jgi:hypothetical protein
LRYFFIFIILTSRFYLFGLFLATNYTSTRIQAASIIRWDYYSGREVVDGWPHLDGYLGAWTKDIRITPADLRAALVQCGYTPKLAKERVPDNHCQFREPANEENTHED